MKVVIRYFFKTVRLIVGPILTIGDALTAPKGIERPTEQQSNIDQETASLVLFQFKTCPFCIKTRRAIKRLSLNIETRDAQRDQDNRQQLLTGGGQIKVPCLQIADTNGNMTWMYESDDIIQYLIQRFT